MKAPQNYASVRRAYAIADECMLAQFICHATATPAGYRRDDESAYEAACWLIARGMARLAVGGLIELLEIEDVEEE